MTSRPYRDYLAKRDAAQQAERRAREDAILAEAARLGDHASDHLKEVAADIRDHRETERRRAAWAAADALDRLTRARAGDDADDTTDEADHHRDRVDEHTQEPTDE